jgi:serine protease AprX
MRSKGTAGGRYGSLLFLLLAILATLLTALVVARPAVSAVPDLRSSSSRLVQVIVRSAAADGAQELVEGLGGSLVRDLPIIGGFAARIPASGLPALEASPLVLSVTPDVRISLASEDGAAGGTNPLARVADRIDVDDLWGHGLTGAGVDIALIDSGVVPVDGLGSVLHGPDLSFESQNPELAHLDTFGHGTHLAGIIAGHDPASGFRGIAPGARIVSLKVADAFGATDVSQVIAAVDWVVQHRQSGGLNIRVLNLAFGTDSGQDYRVDPLAYAVEVAWSKGIVVVVSAGNSGGAGLTDPAYDPFVIAVGAADTTESADGGSVATVPDWSSRGDGTRNPDMVAPGVGIVSLRAPGSFIDEEYPGARVSWPPPPDQEAPEPDPAQEPAGEPAGDFAGEPPAQEEAPVIAPAQGAGAEPSADPPAEPSESTPMELAGEPTATDPAVQPPAADPTAEPPAVDPPAQPPTDPPVDPPADDPPAETPAEPPAEAAPEPAHAPRYFRGSGTSQSAAIVSGVVALMLEERRWLTPNKVKAILAGTAHPLTGDRQAEGAGLVDAGATFGRLVEHSYSGWRRSSGTGSLELVRGSAHVVDPDGVALSGEQDIFGRPWHGPSWAFASLEERAWSGGTWNGSPWAGTGFEGAFWAIAVWNAPAWSARSWAELSWSGRRWSGEEWTGESWWSHGWSGRRWTAASWTAYWRS